MGWLEKRITEAQALKQRDALIRSSAPAIYRSLWTELTLIVEDAKNRSFPIFTNGEAHSRLIKLSQDPPTGGDGIGRPKELRIVLEKDRQRIVASGAGVKVILDLDVCSDGVVCLKLGGDQIHLEDAAEKIMDPFLFPELQPKDSSL